MSMNRQQVTTDLFDTMDTAKRSMHGQMQVVLKGCNISRTQLELLFTIHHGQPTTAKELAQKLQLTPGAISQLAEELDKQQLIKRHIDPADRRRQSLTVSDAGNDLLKTILKRRRTIMEHVMKDLSDAELATWLKIQQKMIQEFQKLHES